VFLYPHCIYGIYGFIPLFFGITVGAVAVLLKLAVFCTVFLHYVRVNVYG